MENKQNIVEYIRSLDVLTKYQQEKIISLHAEDTQKWYIDGEISGRQIEKLNKENMIGEELIDDLMDLVGKVREMKNK